MKFVLGILVFSLVCCGGCVAPARINISLSAYASYDATTKKRFVILPGNQGVTEFNLDFVEAKGVLESALIARGFEAVYDNRKADVFVFVSYGSGTPQTHTQTYQTPVYGQIAGGVSRVNATTIGPGGISTTSGTVIQQPVYGVTGYQTNTSSTTYYQSWVRVDAVDSLEFAKSKKIKSVWTTTIAAGSRNPDLRVMIPTMVSAGAKYFGQSSGSQVSLVVSQ